LPTHESPTEAVSASNPPQPTKPNDDISNLPTSENQKIRFRETRELRKFDTFTA